MFVRLYGPLGQCAPAIFFPGCMSAASTCPRQSGRRAQNVPELAAPRSRERARRAQYRTADPGPSVRRRSANDASAAPPGPTMPRPASTSQRRTASMLYSRAVSVRLPKALVDDARRIHPTLRRACTTGTATAC